MALRKITFAGQIYLNNKNVFLLVAFQGRIDLGFPLSSDFGLPGDASVLKSLYAVARGRIEICGLSFVFGLWCACELMLRTWAIEFLAFTEVCCLFFNFVS